MESSRSDYKSLEVSYHRKRARRVKVSVKTRPSIKRVLRGSIPITCEVQPRVAPPESLNNCLYEPQLPVHWIANAYGCTFNVERYLVCATTSTKYAGGKPRIDR